MNIIDQTRLPHEFITTGLHTLEDAAAAIRGMQVRGAPLIGVTAAYGIYLAILDEASDARVNAAAETLLTTRPTAINLRWAVGNMRRALLDLPIARRVAAAYEQAGALAEEDMALCSAIGDHGLEVLHDLHNRKRTGGTLNILTHCNAGWLATVDWGTALAPIYKAHDAGIPVHVWVDETRPRNQGMLTAWELGQHGVPHTIIVDNAGGHLMQRGLVDLCITGTDRTTAGGDVCNKTGTYLKALAAHANNVPFYVALPGPSIDWELADGVADIPIEARAGSEVTAIAGRNAAGGLITTDLAPAGSTASNYAFDVTPRQYITALITERGISPASREGLRALYAH